MKLYNCKVIIHGSRSSHLIDALLNKNFWYNYVSVQSCSNFDINFKILNVTFSVIKTLVMAGKVISAPSINTKD